MRSRHLFLSVAASLVLAALAAPAAFAGIIGKSTTINITDVAGGGGADGNWLARSTAAGVFQTSGFDTLATLPICPNGPNYDFPGRGIMCYANGDCGLKGFLDTAVYASGISGGNHKSIRLDTQSCGSSNQSGDFWISFPTSRGAGTHWYFSYAWRSHGFTVGTSQANWTSPDMSGQGWKTSVLAAFGGPLCGTNELTIVNFGYENKQRLYTACSSSQHDNFEFADGAGGFNQQQGDYVCKYQDSNIPGHCRVFPADIWEWFYIDVNMHSGNADVKAYSCHAGDGAWKQWINAPAYTWGANSFGMVDFSDYDTSKNNGTPTAAPYSFWYDEYLVSDQPSAVPTGCM